MTSLDDVDGKIIGVELGSSQAQEVEATDAKLKAAGQKGFEKISGFKRFQEWLLPIDPRNYARIEGKLIKRRDAQVAAVKSG